MTLALEQLDITKIRPHPDNPRRTHDPAKAVELVASVQAKGILNPILVWPDKKVGHYLIIAGERRYLAARSAGLDRVPVIVRDDLDESGVIEAMLIENAQREDLNAIEEAEGYALLQRKLGLSTEDIAKRTGKAIRTVQAALQLLALEKPIADAVRAGQLTAGHAILLAKLEPGTEAGQQRGAFAACFKPVDLSAVGPEQQRLITAAEDLRDKFNQKEAKKILGDRKPEDVLPLRAITVRELDDYIKVHTRMAPEGDLLKDVQDAQAAGAKVVEISYLHRDEILPELEDDTLIKGVLFAGHWKRADGTKGTTFEGRTGQRHDSPKCEHAVLGVVTYGPESGERFEVCTAQKACKVHWAKELKAAADRKRLTQHSNASRGAVNQKAREKQIAKEQAEMRERNRQSELWNLVRPLAIAAVLKAKPAALMLAVFTDAVRNSSFYRERFVSHYVKPAQVDIKKLEAGVIAKHPTLAKGYTPEAEKPAAPAKRKAGKKR